MQGADDAKFCQALNGDQVDLIVGIELQDYWHPFFIAMPLIDFVDKLVELFAQFAIGSLLATGTDCQLNKDKVAP
jgi:hypothetical protein